MTRALANKVELALERIAAQTLAGGYDELLEMRRRGPRGWAQIRTVGIRRHLAPTDHHLAFFGDNLADALPAALALVGVRGHEHDAGRKFAGRRQ